MCSFYLIITSVHALTCQLLVNRVVWRTDLDGTLKEFSVTEVYLIASRDSLILWKLVNKLKFIKPQCWHWKYDRCIARWKEGGREENQFLLSGKNVSFSFLGVFLFVWFLFLFFFLRNKVTQREKIKQNTMCLAVNLVCFLMYVIISKERNMFLKENAFCHTRVTSELSWFLQEK